MPLDWAAVELWLAIALLLGAVATVTVASVPWRARLVGWLCMVAVAVVALWPPDSEMVARPLSSRLVRTAETGDLDQAVAVAWLSGPARIDELAVVFDGPMTDGRDLLEVGAVRTEIPPMPWAPDAPQVQLSRRAEVGRPTGFVVRVPGIGHDVDLRVDVRGGGVVAGHDLRVPAGGSATFDFEPRVAGEHRIELSIAEQGVELVRTGRFSVAEPTAVLVVGGGRGLAAALAVQGVRVESVQGLPESLSDFRAVVLAEALDASSQKRLAMAIDDGLGVFATGAGLQSDDSLLAGIWPVTWLPPPPPARSPRPTKGRGAGPTEQPSAEPAEEPVSEPAVDPSTEGAELDPSGPVEVDKHTVTMVFVIDRSASMGQQASLGESRMSFVKSSARATARMLSPGDSVGIVSFGQQGQDRIELPLTDVARIDEIEAGIARLAHGDPRTYLHSALQKAGELLATSDAAVRHVLVLTDGEAHDLGISTSVAARDLLQQHRATVSVLAITDQSFDPTARVELSRMAREGKGAFVPIQQPTFVPKLVSVEVVQALDRAGRKPAATGTASDPGARPPAGEQPLVEAADTPEPAEPPGAEELPAQPAESDEPAPVELVVRAISDSPLLEPVPAGGWPRLGGARLAKATRDAQVLLTVGEQGDTLLAFANRGLGRVAVYCADLQGGESVAVRADPDFPARLSRWVRALDRPVPDAPLALLDGHQVTPRGPTPEERDRLERLSGDELRTSSPPVPEPAWSLRTVDRTPQAAVWLLLAVCVVALVEWYGARRWLSGN